MTVARSPIAFGGAHPFTGWWHADPDAAPTGQVAVICGPTGHEYTRAYRSLRHLADRFARAGIPALRFDYHGIGNSPGDDLDPARLAAWRSNIRAAAEAAGKTLGDRPYFPSAETEGLSPKVLLVGVRLGATLAAQVAEAVPVDRLVLWNPVVTGRNYVRELQAIAATAATVQCDVEGAFESAGFVMSAETQRDIRAIDLKAVAPRARKVLLVGRDDLQPDAALAQAWAAHGIDVESRVLPGWAGMMAEHQFTVVPDAALDAIVAWSRDAQTNAGTYPGTHPGSVPASGEVPVAFDGLAGVLHKPEGEGGKPAVVMFNAGAVHHVGPNRIYVEMARRLAREGHAVLRFDLEGIGDSVLRQEARENHPYPEWATRDAKSAFRFLHEQHGLTRFVALGLCSGAHTAFHAALDIADENIERLVLINPLTFRWVEGMSLETTTRVYDEMAYKQSMKDPRRWVKLLRGDVNFGRLLAVVAAYPGKIARKAWVALCETFLRPLAPPLARQLRKLRALRRPVTFFIADGDPGYELLKAGAPRTTSRMIAKGAVRVVRIPNADHTFSQRVPRQALIDKVAAELAAPAPAPGQARPFGTLRTTSAA